MAHNKAPTPVPAPRQVAARAAAPQWFVTGHGKAVGPVTAEVVALHVADGSLLPSTLVWREGFSAWTPVRDVAEFAPALPRPRLVAPEHAFFNVPDAPVAAPLPGEATRLILFQAGLGRRRAQHVMLGVVGVCCVCGDGILCHASGCSSRVAAARPTRPRTGSTAATRGAAAAA